MLEGKYNKDTKFDASDHRAHRKAAWLEQGLQKVEQLKFITRARAAAWPKRPSSTSWPTRADGRPAQYLR